MKMNITKTCIGALCLTLAAGCLAGEGKRKAQYTNTPEEVKVAQGINDKNTREYKNVRVIDLQDGFFNYSNNGNLITHNFKFVTVEGSLIWLHELGIRQVPFEEAVDKVIQKMNQKKSLLTFDDCIKEAEENCNKILKLFRLVS